MNRLQDNSISHLESLPPYPAGKRLAQTDDRFWASESSDGHTCVILDLNIPASENNTGEIIAAILAHRDTKRPTLLIYRLLDETLRDKFLTMFAAIAHKAAAVPDTKLVSHVTQQILQWAAFLAPSRTGLSDKALQGLWGELYFLKAYLLKKLTPDMVVTTYTGIRGAPQDITSSGFYAEIKTTLTHAPKIIKISSLEQLDPLFNDQILVLFLITPLANGSSVLDLINEIELSLSESPAALFEFKKLVSNATQEASEQQLEKNYKSLNVTAWEIKEDFPSLRRSRLTTAISSAKYDIQISAIEDFRLTRSIEEWIDARTAT